MSSRPRRENMGGAAHGLRRQEENNAPMLALFGGIFALLLVFLLLVNLLFEESLRERLEQAEEKGLYRIHSEHGSEGFVVITFPETLRIVETGEGVQRGRICERDSPFVRYAQRVYGANRKQLVFALLEGSVSTMAEARGCIRQLMPNRPLNIGWIMADNELLKSVSLDDIPPYIRDFAEP